MLVRLIGLLPPEEGRFRRARVWSNQVLRAIGPNFHGSVMNVSGWQDLDKEGGRYRDYFPNATDYLISNHVGTRGLEDGTADYSIDLTAELPVEMHGIVDVAFNHTTLEHIFEVRTAFRNLCLLARKAVIIVVPFVQEQHFTKDYGDFWRFTPQALEALSEENGFVTAGVTWNNQFNTSTYIVFVAVREHVEDSAFAAAPDQHPGEWVGGSRVRRPLSRFLQEGSRARGWTSVLMYTGRHVQRLTTRKQ